MLNHIKRSIKDALGRRGYEIYRRPWLPRGIDPWETLRVLFPRWDPGTIFDIGANVGDTALTLNQRFPMAEVHAFEPIAATHARLCARTGHEPRIHPHCLALGAKVARLSVRLQAHSTLNSLQSDLVQSSSGPEEIVTVSTIDAFCASHGLSRIELVKSDTEGHELSILAGAAAALEKGAIDAILIEAGLIPGDGRFVPLSALSEHLAPFGFVLAGIFDQRGWSHRLAAEFCDALFVRTELLPR